MRPQSTSAAGGRSSSRLAGRFVALTAALVAGLVPGMFIPAPAQAAAGDIVIDADIEDNEDGTFIFEVRRIGGSTTPLSLDYASVAASLPDVHPATPGTDFTVLSDTATFTASARDQVKRLTVRGIADQIDEYDETLALELRNPTTHALVDTAYGLLDDLNPTPTYTLGGPASPVAES